MKIHEYQGKAVLAEYGVPVPKGKVAYTVDEAVEVAKGLGFPVVVKAQIHAGGRGKGGGVKVAKDLEECEAHAKAMLGMTLKTHQTGPEGRVVRRLLIEEGMDLSGAKEMYLAVLVDRATSRPVVMASAQGGMDIEEVAAKDPRRHPEGVGGPGGRLPALPGPQARLRPGARGGGRRQGGALHGRPLPGVRGRRRVAGGDQPAPGHEGRATSSPSTPR